LVGAKNVSSFSNAGVPLRPTIYRHGCSLLDEGAQ
jgi:hypothetical protein